MKDIIIIGAGGVGRETAWIIEQINEEKKKYNILGFIDDNEKLWNKNVNGYKCLGGIDDFLFNVYEYECEVIIAIADYKIKKYIVDKLKAVDIKYATIIHPRVRIPKTTSIGYGTIIYEGVIISPNVIIGNHVLISPKVGIGHDSIIKDYVSLLWNVNISGNDFIEEGAFLGSSSTIVQERKVGRESIIGASSLVLSNIKSYRTVVGIPAKYIK